MSQVKCIATGWGLIESFGPNSDDLSRVKLNFLVIEKCIKIFEDDEIVVNDNQVCTGNLKGDEDTCQ